jgi:DNA-binding XRE family transcriptional regulator
MKGFELAGRRKQANITQAELACELRCHRETIVNVERGDWPDITPEAFSQALAAIQRIAERKQREGTLA